MIIFRDRAELVVTITKRKCPEACWEERKAQGPGLLRKVGLELILSLQLPDSQLFTSTESQGQKGSGQTPGLGLSVSHWAGDRYVFVHLLTERVGVWWHKNHYSPLGSPHNI